MTEAPLPTPKRTGRFLSPRKIARVAGRELGSTALTKGFLIGVFVVPAVLIVVMPLIIFLVEQAEPPVVRGRIAVIDRSGEVAPLLEQRLSTEAIAERRGEQAEAIAEKTQELVGDTPQGQQAAKSIQQAATANLPVIKVDTRDPTADPDAFKQQVRDAMRTEVPLDDPDAQRILGVAVIPENAVQRADGEQAFAGYELFVDKNIDARTVDEIQDSIGWSIREARYQLAGYDRTELEALRTVARTTQEVTETGTRESNLELSLLLPGAFMLLILISVLTGGQYLLTTTIEEKSSRVVEVLLSSVSPLELMTGKVLGQMLVGLALLVVYSGLGIATLVFIFSRLDLINRDRIPGNESEKVSHERRAPIVYRVHVPLPGLGITGANRLLQIEHHLRAGDVRLLASPVLVEAAGKGFGRSIRLMLLQRLLGQFGHPHPAQPTWCIAKGPVTERF